MPAEAFALEPHWLGGRMEIAVRIPMLWTSLEPGQAFPGRMGDSSQQHFTVVTCWRGWPGAGLLMNRLPSYSSLILALGRILETYVFI